MFLVAASTAVAQEAEPDERHEKQQKIGSLTRSNLDRADQEFRRFLAVSRELEQARKDFSAEQISLDELLTAQRRLTAAQVRWATVTTESRGQGAAGDYMTRRAEYAALERGQRDVTLLVRRVDPDQRAAVKAELQRYRDAMREAQRELAKAEHAWKMEYRAQQLGRLRYSR